MVDIMRNAVIWGFDRNGAADCIRQLQSDGVLRVRAWFGERQSCSDCTHEFDDFFVRKFDADTPTDTFRDAGWHRCREALAERLPVFLDMASRTRYGCYKTHHENVHLFHLFVRFFFDFLKRHEVDTVVFSNIPHFGADFVLYAVARHLGVRMILAYQSLAPNRFFCPETLEGFGHFDPNAEPDPDDWLPVREGFEKKLFYMGTFHRFRSRWISLAGRVLKHVVRNRNRLGAFEIAKRFEQAGDFRADVRGLTHSDVQLDRDFVYFPLHLQPELTTSALGGPFGDQMLALERLRDLLPDDWWIYVKENPKQTPHQRGRPFFERLRRLHNVVLVDRSVDTYLLLTHCKFVATITGTAGWEAISGGKCALVFGRAWYRSLPGVFEYRVGLSVDDILDCRFTHDELERRFNAIVAQAYAGVIDPAYIALVSGFSERENVARLRTFVETELHRAG